MAAREFLLPDLGEGLEDAEIVEWRVEVADVVAVDQPLVEVETAKANVELPCPFAGTVVAIHGGPGDRIPVGAPLLTIDVGGDGPELDARGADEARAAAPERPLVGFGVKEAGASGAVAAPPRQASTAVAPGAPVPATPPVRRRARELGIDLAVVPGTGPHGAVTNSDLERFLGSGAARVEESPARTSVAVRGVRRAIAEKMATSRREIPDASSWVDCDATALLAARDRMNATQVDVRVTPFALVLRACIAGLTRFPRLNARYDPEREEIEELSAVHLGIAVQADRGLVVPVIRDAHTRTTLELAAELQRLADGARSAALAPSEQTGSTFTVSNYGAFGVDGGAAIINHPEAAILGVGRFADKPWVVDGRVEVRTVVQLSLSFDHRIMDGGDAGGFLRFVADCVEQPAILLAHA